MTENVQFQKQVAYGLEQIKLKLSMPNDTMQIRNSLMYLPNYPVDLIQRYIVEAQNYWDLHSLTRIDNYLQDGSVIADIGANIGNHTLYWAMEKHAKKVYAFEPVKSTYDILLKNVELNNLADVVIPQQVGLFDEETNASIKNYSAYNIGGTNLNKDESGNIKFVTLDSLDFPEKIDMMKIDVENCEVEVLMGGLKTIKQHKPLIVIESFESNKLIVDTTLKELGYTKAEDLSEADFIYKYTED